MQELPGAPGTARQGRTRIIVSTNDGGTATQQRAPGHDRPRTASSGAARHDRPRATPRAPGADVPPATPAGAPGQHRLRAVPSAPVSDRSRARHTMAPGHGRPLATSSGVAGHDRPRATPRAPGADVPPATTAGAPGQHCLSAVPPAPDHDRSRARHTMAPGHGRPLATPSGVVGHDRPCATLTAPSVDVPLASTAGAPGQHRPSAVAIATAPSPSGLRRPRQECLPRVPANPRTLTYPHSHHTAAAFSRQRKSGHVPTSAVGAQHVAPIPPRSGGPQNWTAFAPRLLPVPLHCGGTTGGPNGRSSRPATRGSADSPSLPGKGPGVRSKPLPNKKPTHMGRPTHAQTDLLSHFTTHLVHPAIQVPPHPRPCSTAATGFLHQRRSRAPPRPVVEDLPVPALFSPLQMLERGRG